MSWESIALINKQGVRRYLGDYGVYLGSTKGDLPTQNFLPPSESIVESVPRMDGQYFFGKKLKPRTINYEFFFENKTEAEINNIKQLFYCYEPHQLVSDYTQYKYIWVTLSDSQIDLSYSWNGHDYSGLIEVSFIAHNPRYYSTFLAEDLPLGYQEDFPPTLVYDVGLPYAEDAPNVGFTNVKTNGTITIPNLGNYPANVCLKMVGSCTNLVVTNITNGQSFTISSMSDDVIFLDGTRGQVRDETTLQTDIFEGEFITLNPNDNIITIQADSINLSQLIFGYRYTYI